ncbi:circadian-associated transcriptional repressor [Guaruba guarouba]
MELPPRACSCASPTSDSEAEGGGPVPAPPTLSAAPSAGGGRDEPPPGPPPPPALGSGPGKGRGESRGPPPPSDADRVFAQKCQELGGFIRPLEELLEGLQRGRFHRGLSSFQQSVAMDRLHRIIGALRNPRMGARYLATLLHVERMLRAWFPHVTPKPPPRRPSPRSAAPAA